jgi:hypothetical protein
MTNDTKVAGAMMSMFEPNVRSCEKICDRDRLRRAGECQRDEQVVPRPEELEDPERCDCGQAERQDHAQEDVELGRAES